MSISLPNNNTQGLAAASGYTSAATVFTIPSNAFPWARVAFRHVGTSGLWYGKYKGGTPTTSSYDFVLAPGESEQRDNPPLGAINLLSSGSGIGNCEYSGSWKA
jgi:hypothetical protein